MSGGDPGSEFELTDSGAVDVQDLLILPSRRAAVALCHSSALRRTLAALSMIFRLTQKLNKKIDAGPLPTVPLDDCPWGDWSARLSSPFDVGFRLNETPMSAIGTRESGGYGFPREVFKQLAVRTEDRSS